MPKIRTFTDVETALANLKPIVMVRHLRMPLVMSELMAFLGNPQDSYKVVHVAGTSGKTSTAYYAAALLQAAGKRVGLNISPHAETINERVQINLEPLAEPAFCEAFARFLEKVAASGLKPNYFQMITAFAFWQFAEQKVDYAVIEVGIGGLADSTNVTLRPDKICVITDIGYAHMEVLGHTLPEIAANKAGIIQKHNAAFCRSQAEEILEPVRLRAKTMQAELHIVTEVSKMAFLPPFQRRNFAMAEAAVQFALRRDGQPPLDQQMLAGAAHTFIPSRLETFTVQGKTVVLDAAHNPQKMTALKESLQARFPDTPMAMLFASTKGQRTHYENMLREAVELPAYIILSGFPPDITGRYSSASPLRLQKLLDLLDGQGEAIPDVAGAYAALLARPEPVLIVTGSFYLLNHVRPLMTR